MSKLDDKINKNFPGLVVRKDLTKLVKGNAIVPTYVLEYLLGQYCATDDEETINLGIETVKNVLAKHYVNRSDAELIKSLIKEKGRYKVIDKIAVNLNDKTDSYDAEFSNLGLKKIEINSEYIKNHPKLLTGGVWCIIDMEYVASEDAKSTPWVIETLKPIQISNFDLNLYLNSRENFTKEEWINLLLQSMGFNPELLGERNKLYQLIRLVSFCERNYNVIELGPKGTGKSHIFSEFSPHGILISGGEISVAKLFVNNSSGKIGLVGYWDTVAFDEFAGKDKKVDKNLVDIMKNYMANKSFSRGIETLGADASMAFIGNTKRSVPYMLKHSHLFDELPDKYIDSAFLDRLHFYIPGWEIDVLRNELFSDGYGFIVDYLAEVLKHLRNEDYSQYYTKYFELSPDIATRDRDAIQKTFSGLMKIIFPRGECSKDEVKELLSFALEGRRRIKTQLKRIDDTFPDVNFSYTDFETNEVTEVFTLEEEEYPTLIDTEKKEDNNKVEITSTSIKKVTEEVVLEAGKQKIVKENTKGISYKTLFAPYLKGASEVVINDPYVRVFYQIKNVSEFLQMLIQIKDIGEEINVKLITKYNDEHKSENDQLFNQLSESFSGSGINFTFDYNMRDTFHARSIQTDTGWKITLDRGLDIFLPYDYKNPFNLANQIQEQRMCKGFEVTYLKV